MTLTAAVLTANMSPATMPADTLTPNGAIETNTIEDSMLQIQMLKHKLTTVNAALAARSRPAQQKISSPPYTDNEVFRTQACV